MNTRHLAAFAVLAASLLLAVPAEAAKKNRPGKDGKRSAARMLGRFDANHDGSLDAKEAQRLRGAFAVLKGLDADKNGELSDAEIGAAKIDTKRKGRKRNR